MAVKSDSNDGVETVEVRLPSGLNVVLMRQGKLKGKDLIRAQRAIPAADGASPMAMAYAMLAPRVSINGRAQVYEDLLEMDLEDINALMAADGNFQTPAAAEPPALPASSGSSGSASD